MSKNSRVLSGLLAAATVGAVCVSSKHKMKKYSEPVYKFDFSFEKLLNYVDYGLDKAEQYFNKKNPTDTIIDKAEENEI